MWAAEFRAEEADPKPTQHQQAAAAAAAAAAAEVAAEGARAVKVRELVAAEAAETQVRTAVVGLQALLRRAVVVCCAAAAAAAAAAADFRTFPAALPNETGSDCTHRFRAPSSGERGSRTDNNSGTSADLPQLLESD